MVNPSTESERDKMENDSSKSNPSSILPSSITNTDNEGESVKQKFERIKQIAQEKHKTITLKDQIIARNRDKITDLEEQNQNKEQQIIQLEKAVKENQEIIDGHVNTVNEKDDKIDELKKESKKKDQEIEQLKQTLSDIKKSLDESDTESTQAKIKVAELLRKSTMLQEENNQLKNEIVFLQTKVRESEITIHQMESEAQAKENQITRLRETNSKLVDSCQQITVETSGLDCEIKTLSTSSLYYNGEKWSDEYGAGIPIYHSCCKIYVEDLLKIESLPAAKFTPLIDRLHSNSFCKLYLKDLTISFDDYKKLVGKGDIRLLYIIQVTVTNENGTLISVDQLLMEVPDIERFHYYFNDGEKMDEISQNFSRLPPMTNLCIFKFSNVQEGFDFETFGQFIKTYATEYGGFEFAFNVSKEIFAEIQRIQKEIVSTLPSSFRLSIYNCES